MITNKRSDSLYFYEDKGIEYFNMTPELTGHYDEQGNYHEGETYADFWIFDLIQYEYIINSNSKTPPTDEEWTTSWELSAEDTVFELVNRELPKGFFITKGGWLGWVKVDKDFELSYEDAKLIFSGSLNRAEILGKLFETVSYVVKAVYQLNGSEVF